MDNGMVGAEVEGTQVSSNSTVEDASFLQDIPKVDVGIQEVRIQSNSLCLKNNYISSHSNQKGIC